MLRPLLLATMFFCAAGGAEAQTISLPGPGGVTLRAVLVLPAQDVAPRAPVIALHGCAGLGAAERPPRLPAREQDWAVRLTAAGHAVLFPDSFGSRGLSPACGRPDHPASSRTVRRADALAAAAWAAGQPWAPRGGVVLLGWSHGGSTVLAAAEDPPQGIIRAAISFYPGCGPLTFPRQPSPSVPLLLLLGEADDWTPPTPCRRLAARHPGQVEMVAFAGAGHGFDSQNPTPRRLTLPDGRVVTTGGDPTARAEAIRLVEGFLARYASAPDGR